MYGLMNIWGARGRYKIENSIQFIRNETSGEKNVSGNQRDQPDDRAVGGSVK